MEVSGVICPAIDIVVPSPLIITEKSAASLIERNDEAKTIIPTKLDLLVLIVIECIYASNIPRIVRLPVVLQMFLGRRF